MSPLRHERSFLKCKPCRCDHASSASAYSSKVKRCTHFTPRNDETLSALKFPDRHLVTFIGYCEEMTSSASPAKAYHCGRLGSAVTTMPVIGIPFRSLAGAKRTRFEFPIV